MKDRKIWMEKMKWKDSIWIENCPFCQDNSESDNLWFVKKFKFWNIKKNLYPYNWIKDHLLLIPYRHIEHTKLLNENELIELKEINEFIEKYFGEQNYFSFIRETNWWKSVKHIHYHYLPWILFSDKMEEIMKEQHKNLEKIY